MKTFRLPDLGEGIQEAEIVAWHVSEGDRVVVDQPLVSVETDKAIVEIPSPQGGIIQSLAGEPGDLIPVDAMLVEFAEGERIDRGALVGRLPEAPQAASPTPEEPEPAESLVSGPAPAVRATPAVRTLARRLGVDLATVVPSGPGGVATSADVEQAAERQAPGDGVESLRGVRRSMARNMARAATQVAATTVVDDADIGDWKPGTDVTVRLLRALAAGCSASPALNTWFDPEREERTAHTRVDAGIAIDTDDGLIVPVITDVGGRSEEDLREEIEELKDAVLKRTIPLERLRGATITLSNFGMLAGRYATLIVMPPQVAILGAGRISPRIVPVESGVATRRILPLSLTFDHRVVTGGEAARFLAAAIADLGLPD